MTHYEVIVIGTGGIGSAAVTQLAERGVSVLGIDRFSHGHDRGSSHGKTRIIRQAYFEHPDYVPRLLRAYDLWESLAEQAGEPLYEEVGLLEVGRPEGELIQGVLHAARTHRLTVHSLTAAEVHARWRGFRIPEGYTEILEPRAGFLRIEACILAYLRAAEACGATLKTGIEGRLLHDRRGSLFRWHRPRAGWRPSRRHVGAYAHRTERPPLPSGALGLDEL